MSPLLVVSAHDAIRVFEEIGYRQVRQRGSHIRLRDDTNPTRLPLTVPNHKTLKPGLLRKLIRDAGLTVDEFNQLLKPK